ncbi:MAG TPA: histidinol dehydrogenase [Cyclobacteriaceae bacterium]|nr:histidinol dehydrogenase [Cyclobacteriaceae bacterium]
MKQFKNPAENTWAELARRPQLELEFLESSVRNIVNRVRSSGDYALKDFALRFDKARIEQLLVSREEIESGNKKLNVDVQQAITTAANNIRKFHAAQKSVNAKIETTPGVFCWRKQVPIQKVGLYIPGGTAPLFSTVLMLAIPAQIAGCGEVVICTPPHEDGSVNEAILFAASLAGVSRIFKVGGAQAIAAMAYGTESIPAVHKIFGPGNQYVTKAKQMVNQEGIAIDLPAGPSEVMVIVDEAADSAFVAADLLSQAEHGVDSQVVLLSLSKFKVNEIMKEIEAQLAALPRKDIARQALENSMAIFFESKAQCMAFANAYAPEHLIINTIDCEQLGESVVNAGSVFLGPYSPESIGDYASGTNHTLPTNGFAKAYSGVSLDSFMKTITYQKLTMDGLKKLGPVVETLADAENLRGHRTAVSLRLNKIK